MPSPRRPHAGEVDRIPFRPMRTMLPGSPMAPGSGPVSMAYRDVGVGPPLLVLHGGWGARFYPFADVAGHRMLLPDRTGYGASSRVEEFPRPFHPAAQAEAELFLDALGITRCALWGHSDGAVVAARMAIADPSRYSAVILEAVHFDCAKPSSRAFFETMVEDPDAFGKRAVGKLAADHGAAWRTPLRADGRAWIDIARTPSFDLYDGRLSELHVRTLAIHGSLDPRTEPGELERLRATAPQVGLHMIAGARHSPHSERSSAAECLRVATEFLARA